VTEGGFNVFRIKKKLVSLTMDCNEVIGCA